jgi:putative membrane protein
MLIHWIISALLLLVVSHIVPGFIVSGFFPALVAALVMGLVNATLGLFLKVLTFPLTLVTFGVFLLVINALMLLLTSHVVRGFTVQGFRPAFWGALLLAILQFLMRWLAPGRAI